jgi:hypothetical protein
MFGKLYGFEVMRGCLDNSRRAQIQMNKYLSDFVYHHNGPNHLLIIYYAGHGWSDTNEDQSREILILNG